jgi:hypothetical protein
VNKRNISDVKEGKMEHETNRSFMIRGLIRKATSPMSMRHILGKYEFELVCNKSLQTRYEAKANEITELWNKDSVEREMMRDLKDDFQGMMENPRPKPQDPVVIANTYEAGEAVYKTIRRLPKRDKVNISITDLRVKGKLLEEIEYEVIRQALEETNKLQEAADIIGFSYRTLTNKLMTYERKFGVATRFEVESNIYKDVILAKPTHDEVVAVAEIKPIRTRVRHNHQELKKSDYKLAAKCEHNWKLDWLESGLCMNCYKDKIISDRLKLN